MSWRDNLVSASFRDAKFKVMNSETKFGRRIDVAMFPNSDKADIKDLGQDENSFSLDCYVIANSTNDFNYFKDRDALIKAIKTKGIGILVHPFFGNLNVQVRGCILNESFGEGGIARFKIDFVNADVSIQNTVVPKQKKDNISSVDNQLEDSDAVSADSFSERNSSERSDIVGLLNGIRKGMQQVAKFLSTIKSITLNAISASQGYISKAMILIDNTVDAPCDLYNYISGVCNTFSNICGLGNEIVAGGITGACSGVTRNEQILDGNSILDEQGKSTVDAMLLLNETINDDLFSGISDSQITNSYAAVDAFKYCIISQACKISIRTEFLDSDSCLLYAKKILDSFDSFLLRLGQEKDNSEYEYIDGNFIDNTMLYNSIEDLRNIFFEAMIDKSSSLKKIMEYVPGSEIENILKLAHDKYNDLGRETEIFNLNKNLIKHPGFLPNGVELRILSE